MELHKASLLASWSTARSFSGTTGGLSQRASSASRASSLASRGPWGASPDGRARPAGPPPWCRRRPLRPSRSPPLQGSASTGGPDGGRRKKADEHHRLCMQPDGRFRSRKG